MGQFNKDIVMIGLEEEWELIDIHVRSLMLSRAFMRLEAIKKVVIINCPLSFPRRIKNNFAGRKRMEDIYPLILKRKGISIMKLGEKAFMINLTSLLPESDNIFSKMDRWFIFKNILWALKYLGFDDYMLWISQPRIVDIAKKMPAKIKIFDTVDNLMFHNQLKRFRKKIKRAYEWVNRNADLVVISSVSQRKMFSPDTNLFLSPSAVDPIFQKCENRFIPEDIRNIKKPLVGYVGVLQDRIDIDLMGEVIKLLPNHSFVFVGRVLTPAYFKTIMNYPNVHFLGHRKSADIPDYMKNFDVCIIPHKINELTNSMNPLKIYEYLACGRPIVSTPVAGIEDFEKYIYLAKDSKAFSGAIVKSIFDNNGTLEKERRDIVHPHSWDNRAKDLMLKIAGL